MKKIVFVIIIFFFFGTGLRAQQTNLTQAVDFTVTDCHGQTYNLFEILDRGQAVFIDFFFRTCGQCQVISPYITGSYTQMGCNMGDVFYIEISYIDNDAGCQIWADEFGVEFPTVGKDGGGNEVFQLYGIQGCPTLVLIMPDRSIPIQGLLQLYPMSVQDVVNAMQQNGLQTHDCNGVGVIENNTPFTVFPNPTKEKVTIDGVEAAEMQVFNTLGQLVKTVKGTNEINVSDIAEGVYLLRVSTINSEIYQTRLVVRR